MRKMNSEKSTYDRLPPQNIDAEETIIASVLIDNGELTKVQGIIKPEDFYRTAHRKIFSAMLDMFAEGDLIDLVTLAEKLKKQNRLDEIGGAVYLTKLIDCAPVASNSRNIAMIIKEKSLKRVAIKGANNLMNVAFDDVPVSEILSIISQLQSKIISMVPGDEDAVKLEVDVESFLSSGFVAETPFKSLNEIIEGIIPGELMIIGGRPGMGKTALALQIIEYLAIAQGEPVLYCGAQMDRKRIYLRILAERCNVNFRKLFARRPPREKHASLLKNQAIIDGADIREFVIKEEIELPELWAQIKRVIEEVELKLIVIENLQQLAWPGMRFKTDYERASFMVEKIRPFGIGTQIPIIVSSQLNRDVEDNENKRPKPSDIFGKKAEELSDIIVFPFRPNYYEQRKIEKEGKPEEDAELIISKGASPITLPFTFWGEYLKWEEK